MDKDLFYPHNLRFSSERALVLAQMSALAYKPAEEISAGLKQSDHKSVFIFEKDDTEGFFSVKGRSAFLIFRGTEKNSLQDWLTDFNVKLVPCGRGKVHRGVNLALDRVWDKLENRIIEHGRGKKIWCAGHSLGGALAMLAFYRLAQSKADLGGLYTFGQPCLGNKKFARDFNLKLRKISFRLVSEGDLTAWVPPRILNYAHCGRLIYLKSYGRSYQEDFPVKTGFDRAGKNIVKAGEYYRFLRDRFPERVKAHSLVNYLLLLKKTI